MMKPQGDREEQAPLWRRLLWFAALWVAGVAAVAAVAYGIRFMIG